MPDNLLEAPEIPEEIDSFEDLDFDIDPGESDEVLLRKFNKAISLAKPSHDEHLKRWDDNYKLLTGKHLELSRMGSRRRIDKYKSDTVINLIFPGYRNIVGMMTDAKPQPVVWPAPATDPEQREKNRAHAEHLYEMVDQRWREVQMELEIPIMLFQGLTFNDSFLKWYWDYYQDDVAAEVVSPYDLMVYPDVGIDEADFVIQTSERTYTWIKTRYPGKVAEIKKNFKKKDDLFKVEELWTDNVCVIRTGNVILEAKYNPGFEFRDEEKQRQEWAESGADMAQFRPIRNYLNFPRKPYCQFMTYKSGKGTYSNISQTEQLEPIQISFNQRKRQIDDNANAVGNSKMLYDPNVFPQIEAEKHSGRPGEKIGVPGIADKPGALRFESGTPLPEYLMGDMTHTQKVYDDVLGQHDTSRGAQGRTKTAREAEILREADQTVVRLLSRNADVTYGRLVEGWVQLMGLYYTTPKYIRRMGAEYAEFSRHSIDVGIKIQINVGSTLPTDAMTQRKDAAMFASFQMIAPIDLYTIHNMPNPQKMADNLAKWQASQSGQPMAENDDIAAENMALAQGQQVPVAPDDKHEQHIASHNTEATKLGEELPPEAQDAFVYHIAEHEKMSQTVPNPDDQGSGQQNMGGGMPKGMNQQGKMVPNQII